MNPIETGLRQEIPLEHAANFFIKLKYGSAKNMDQRGIEFLKHKMAEGMGSIGAAGAPAALPPGGMGKNMAMSTPPALPATAMGQQKVAMTRAKERAHEQLEAKYEKHQHTKGERAAGNLVSILGAAAGGAAGHHFGKSPHATAAGILTGYGAGKSLGKSMGTSLDAAKFKKHAMFKRALDEMFGSGVSAPSSMAPQVDMSQYMAMEEMGEQAEQANQSEFLRNKLQDAYSQLQAAQDQASMANQQAQQLMGQQSSHEAQLQSAQQQAQLSTQAAMQNVQHAHDLAMQATTQALQAKDDSINTHQLAAQMRMAYQSLRGQIMDSVAQDNAAPIGEAIKAQGVASVQAPAMNGEAPGAENTNPDMQPAQEGPADKAIPAAAGPTAAPAAGGESPPNMANSDGTGGEGLSSVAKPANNMIDSPQPGVGGSAKQASATSMMGAAGDYLKERGPHMAAGALLGGAGTALESHIGHQGLRDKVQRLEGESGGGFSKALQLAAAKTHLAFGEVAERHPVMATLGGAISGAATGAMAGPQFVRTMADFPGKMRELDIPGKLRSAIK